MKDAKYSLHERSLLLKEWMQEKNGLTRVELLRKITAIESHIRRTKQT